LKWNYARPQKLKCFFLGREEAINTHTTTQDKMPKRSQRTTWQCARQAQRSQNARAGVKQQRREANHAWQDEMKATLEVKEDRKIPVQERELMRKFIEEHHPEARVLYIESPRKTWRVSLKDMPTQYEVVFY